MNVEKKNNRSISKRGFRSGAYSTVLAIVVIVVVLLVNLFVGELDLSLDLTAENRYTLTEQSLQLLKDLQDEITIYFMVQEGSQQPIVEKVINQYDAFSKINVVVKDPLVYPTFAQQFTEAEVLQNDVIVVNERTKASQHISVNDVVAEEMDQSTYSSYYTLDAEGQITAAIQFVTNEEMVKMYAMAGHNEEAVGEEFAKLLRKGGVTTETFESAMAEAVPEDCDILFINGPDYDLTEQELQMVKDYLEKGGKGILTAKYAQGELPNYMSLLNYYGADVVDGVVFETSGNYFPPYPINIRPNANQEHEVSASLPEGKILVIPQAKGFRLVESHRGSLTLETVLSTSQGAFSRTQSLDSLEQQPEDIAGPFELGVLATDVFKDFETKVAIYGGAQMFDDALMTTGQYANGDLFLNTTQWLVGSKTPRIVVPVRSLAETYLVVPPSNKIALGVVTIFLIPVGLLLFGFGIWFVRRKS